MRVIGVTGGIGSGKSSVSRILKNLGAEVIDADQICHEITEKGEKALDELVDCFGNDILNEEGELDRKKLAHIVFNDQEKLSQLNRIMHKHVIERIDNYLAEFRKDGTEIVVIDAPLPIKQFLDRVDEVWVVTADREERIRRVMKRSSLSYDEVVKRINSQIPDEEYLRIADKVIVNNGDLNSLSDRVKEMLQGDIN